MSVKLLYYVREGNLVLAIVKLSDSTRPRSIQGSDYYVTSELEKLGLRGVVPTVNPKGYKKL